MKILAFFLLSLVSLIPAQASFLAKFAKKPNYLLQEGDLVFQDTGGRQGAAVRAATNSPYTHCGVVFKEGHKFYVFEALQPVCVTPLEKWKRRSRIFYAMRLKDPSPITAEAIKKARTWAKMQIAKPYDLKFQWDNESLYCSELVWKLYHKALGIQLCKTNRFQHYFLKKPEVKSIIIQRYGSETALPKNEPVVAPSDLANSSLLREVPRRSKKG